MIGIIVALGIAIGAAFGIGKIGWGVGQGFEAIGKDIGKAIQTLTVIVGVSLIIMTLLFFMTRSKATVGAGPVQATATGGGAVQHG